LKGLALERAPDLARLSGVLSLFTFSRLFGTLGCLKGLMLEGTPDLARLSGAVSLFTFSRLFGTPATRCIAPCFSLIFQNSIAPMTATCVLWCFMQCAS
jgi:hypothetical protein